LQQIKIQKFKNIQNKNSHKNNNLWLTMHTIPWTYNVVSELGYIIWKFVVQNSEEPLGPGSGLSGFDGALVEHGTQGIL
jgi:hypothetical protein